MEHFCSTGTSGSCSSGDGDCWGVEKEADSWRSGCASARAVDWRSGGSDWMSARTANWEPEAGVGEASDEKPETGIGQTTIDGMPGADEGQ